MFGTNRDELRQFYLDSWNKFKENQVLNPLEQQIVAVIKEHPEYHKFLEEGESTLASDFHPELGETNPFLHMGMHLGLIEQVSTNRPAGIEELYQKITVQHGRHEAEHQMMECLAEAIWTAQRNNTAPDDTSYLQCLQKLVVRKE